MMNYNFHQLNMILHLKGRHPDWKVLENVIESMLEVPPWKTSRRYVFRVQAGTPCQRSLSGWFFGKFQQVQTNNFLVQFLTSKVIYPSSHNHGSGKWVYLQYEFPFIWGNCPLNHDYGRKGNNQQLFRSKEKRKTQKRLFLGFMERSHQPKWNFIPPKKAKEIPCQNKKITSLLEKLYRFASILGLSHWCTKAETNQHFPYCYPGCFACIKDYSYHPGGFIKNKLLLLKKPEMKGLDDLIFKNS